MLQFPLATIAWLAAQVPEDFSKRAGEIVDQVKENPTLAAILLGIGILAIVVFIWGITKQAFKAAFLAAVLGAGAWFWYFNVR
jgi:uncharacterized membrane protein